MKPFDLEAALRGEPVVTRSGKPVTQLHLFDAKNVTYPLVGVCDGDIRTYTLNGRSFFEERDESNFDLFMAKPEWWGVFVDDPHCNIPRYISAHQKKQKAEEVALTFSAEFNPRVIKLS